MSTWRKGPIVPVYPASNTLEFASFYGPEDATQTFVSGDVLKRVAGFLQVSASPATAAQGIFGVAITVGNNDAVAGTHNARFAPIFPGMFLFGNLLMDAAANGTLAATDFGLSVNLERNANLLGAGKPGWYFNKQTVAQAVAKIVNFYGDPTFMDPASPAAQQAKVGDINARVLACPLAAATAFTV